MGPEPGPGLADAALKLASRLARNPKKRGIMRICAPPGARHSNWTAVTSRRARNRRAYKADSPLLRRLLCGKHEILHLCSVRSDGLHHVVESCKRQRGRKSAVSESPDCRFGPVL